VSAIGLAAMSRASFSIEPEGTGATVAIRGDWSSLTIGSDALELPGALSAISGIKRLDLSNAGRIDTAGAYLILRATTPTFESSLMPKEHRRIFALVNPLLEQEAAPASGPSWLYRYFDRIGRKLVHAGSEIYATLSYGGHVWIQIARTITSPSKFRLTPLARMMEIAGVDALPIIMLLNFFIGAVVALVGASLLTDLGVAVFTVQLVGVAVLREFAVLFTGILLAGRSASAFAAQIGSMKMAQEIDAMQVIGVDKYEALVLPRVFALLLMMPVQIFAGMVAGIAGGLLICWAMLDMSPVFFFQRLHDTVPVKHFWIGMSKAPLLAVLIALAGCRHGLFVGGDVESLGTRVTSAVVQAIVMIIFFDALFAIVYMELHL
jgi:phospholipid/cholesterol/gamma-HCH transport system permease protein